MLSFIYRLCREFEQEHGYWPNTLIVNQRHFASLDSGTENSVNLSIVRDRMGLEIMIRRDCVHPTVGWYRTASRATG